MRDLSGSSGQNASKVPKKVPGKVPSVGNNLLLKSSTPFVAVRCAVGAESSKSLIFHIRSN